MAHVVFLGTSQLIDKSAWPDGPWKSEPDHVVFKHAGLDCELQRGKRYGGWHGYVFVPATLAVYYLPDWPLKVHEGVTYHGREREGGRVVVAFDCEHVYDGVPLDERRRSRDPYRTIDFALSECCKLADQIADATPLRVFAKCSWDLLRWAVTAQFGHGPAFELRRVCDKPLAWLQKVTLP